MSRKRLCSWCRIGVLVAALLPTRSAVAVDERAPSFWRVARVAGSTLGCLDGQAAVAVEMVACRATCAPIPWQLDERDAGGQFALGDGPEPTFDDPPGVIDGNDDIIWMAGDAGRRIRADEAPRSDCAREFEIRTADGPAWAYAFVVTAPAPRSPVSYVQYDPATDMVRAARVAIGFGAPTPRYLALRNDEGSFGDNLLDRLKVRASARFLGIVPLGRTEDDIEWVFGAWRAGPIRVIRREWQWVRLGWGLRTPIFRSESFVYRDFVELPVRLRLNFPPAYFFAGIEVQAVLDFRDLRGWSVRTVGGPAGVVGALPARGAAQVSSTESDWIALEGPAVTLVLRLQLSDSFASLHRRLLYREVVRGAEPEGVTGEHPGIGFRLTDWGGVARGEHSFTAIATALPTAYGIDRFLSDDARFTPVDGRDVEWRDQ